MHAQAQTGLCLQQMKNHAREPSCILAVTYTYVYVYLKHVCVHCVILLTSGMNTQE